MNTMPRTHTEDGGFLTLAPEPWVAGALCATTDSEIFFPEKKGDASAAKRVCASCDVVTECLAYALRTRQTVGVWGGKTERQLRDMRKKARAT